VSDKGSPRRLDVRGTLCPVPVLRSARAVRRLAPGDLLEVVGDDPLMRLDMAAWCAREGHELVELVSEEGTVRCVLRVGERGDARATPGPTG
jgi:tRNA 2-thiouridine synthesizing protein A